MEGRMSPVVAALCQTNKMLTTCILPENKSQGPGGSVAQTC